MVPYVVYSRPMDEQGLYIFNFVTFWFLILRTRLTIRNAIHGFHRCKPISTAYFVRRYLFGRLNDKDICLAIYSFKDACLTGPLMQSLLIRMWQYERPLASRSQRVDIDIVCGTLRTTSTSILRDSRHVIPISIRFIKDG